jgi:hypothetical protein
VSRTATAAGAAVAGVFALLVGLVILGGGSQAAAIQTNVGAPTRLDASAVPGWAASLLTRAARTCPQITAPVLAAQIQAESGWKTHAVSVAGAQGLAQFTPDTWITWGADGNGDGRRDPFTPADAIAAQAAFMCHLVHVVAADEALSGGRLDLALAAYNAGLGAVKTYGGVPPYAETTAYVARIRTLIGKVAVGGWQIGGQPAGTAAAVIAAGKRWIGTPYAWGGGTLNGPSEGFGSGAGVIGFDCSSFIRYAYYHGTGGKITLPRTAAAQYAATKDHPVPLSGLRPGDLLFWGASAASIHHEAIYLGRGRMLEAPHTGQAVKIRAVYTAGYYGATRIL